MFRPWGVSAELRSLYLVGEGEEHRIGNCWAQGRIRAGDLILCEQHRGDHFYSYTLIEHIKRFGGREVSLRRVPARFGAYSMGEKVAQLTEEQCARLVSGERVYVPNFGPYLSGEQEAE